MSAAAPLRLSQIAVIAIDLDGKIRARLADDAPTAKAIEASLVASGRYSHVGLCKPYQVTTAAATKGAAA